MLTINGTQRMTVIKYRSKYILVQDCCYCEKKKRRTWSSQHFCHLNFPLRGNTTPYWIHAWLQLPQCTFEPQKHCFTSLCIRSIIHRSCLSSLIHVSFVISKLLLFKQLLLFVGNSSLISPNLVPRAISTFKMAGPRDACVSLGGTNITPLPWYKCPDNLLCCDHVSWVNSLVFVSTIFNNSLPYIKLRICFKKTFDTVRTMTLLSSLTNWHRASV